MREAIHKIAGGFINSDCLMSDPPDWHSAFGQLQAIAQRANALPPSAASLRYQRLVDVVEAARSFVAALYAWANKGGWPGDKCRVLREALAALDQPPQEPGHD